MRRAQHSMPAHSHTVCLGLPTSAQRQQLTPGCLSGLERIQAHRAGGGVQGPQPLCRQLHRGQRRNLLGAQALAGLVACGSRGGAVARGGVGWGGRVGGGGAALQPHAVP